MALPESITKEEISKFPLIRYGGKVKVVASAGDLKQALEELANETFLGFDTESRPSFVKGDVFLPSLVQLAGSKTVYLFQLSALKGLGDLKSLLSNARILKVGVAIHDDIKRLKLIEDFKEGGFVEISNITEKMGIINKGLRSLVGLFMRRRISKSMQTSNWAQTKLSPKQITYAATDAWISRELYLKVKAFG